MGARGSELGATAALPPLYARWIDQLLDGPIPAETKATCDDCAMCRPKDARAPRGELFYSPITKCCTFLPELANFLVGGILGDDDPALAEGRRSVEKRIDAGADVTPLGLGRGRKFTLLYEHGKSAFGQATSMACPHHLPDGRCGVWRHRESTCATWFCKHERGLTGQRFWARLHDLLAVAERRLSFWCVLELGIDAAPLEVLYAGRRAGLVAGASGLGTGDLDGTIDAATYRALWGPWLGREREIYRRCAELVEKLRWQDVLEIGGIDLQLAARVTRAAHDRLLSTRVPDRLRPRALRVLLDSPHRAQLVTYSEIDALSVPKVLIEALHHFDGRPTAEVIESIAAEHDVRLQPGVVRKLVDFDVLRAPE
jgi:hypothetical protein